MSDVAHTPASNAHQAAPQIEELFSSAELRQFDAEDAEAGRHIAKLLSFFFIYTLLAMCVAIGWSFAVIKH